MPADRERVVAKLRQDHEYMAGLMHRIGAMCARDEAVENCNGCQLSQRILCHDNIGQLIRGFVEVTLRHNLVESACMGEYIPRAHRIAHNRAHLEIAEQIKTIRLVFAADGNSVVAIEGIDGVFGTLSAHMADYDQALERYLLAAA
jgi:hemerythrin